MAKYSTSAYKPMLIEGTYLDGQTSKPISAQLQMQADNTARFYLTREHQATQQLTIPFDQLHIESRLGNTPREIILGNGQLFLTDDHESIEQLLKSQNHCRANTLIHKIESSLPLVAAFTSITVGLIWLLITFGIPLAAKTIAFNMPDLANKQMGTVLDALDESVFEPSLITHYRQQQLRDLLLPYATTFGTLEPTLEFRKGMGANAFALPQGDVVITDELVELAENDEELIAIFFHELGHLQHKHIVRRALQDSMVTLLLILVTGELDNIDVLTAVPTLLLDLSYSRQFEIQADIFAIEHMHKQGIDVKHFASIMQKIEQHYAANADTSDRSTDSINEKHSAVQWLSTHPATDERIKLINTYRNQPL